MLNSNQFKGYRFTSVCFFAESPLWRWLRWFFIPMITVYGLIVNAVDIYIYIRMI